MENTFYIKICFVNIVFVFLAWVALRCPSARGSHVGFRSFSVRSIWHFARVLAKHDAETALVLWLRCC